MISQTHHALADDKQSRQQILFIPKERDNNNKNLMKEDKMVITTKSGSDSVM